MKRKLIMEEWLSLDGHVADKEGKLDFFVKHIFEAYTTAHRLAMLDSLDTILFGRHTYQQFAALWPHRPIEGNVIAEKINTLPKIVFSQSLETAPWGQWPGATVEAGNPAERLRALKAQPGKNLVLWGSISLAQALMNANLIDEYHLHLCPTLTGGGRKLFAGESTPVDFSLIETTAFANGVVLLKYGKPEIINTQTHD